MNSADRISNEFILCGGVILDLLFGDPDQTILDATKRLINQIVVHFDQRNRIAGCSCDLKNVPTFYFFLVDKCAAFYNARFLFAIVIGFRWIKLYKFILYHSLVHDNLIDWYYINLIAVMNKLVE